VTRPSALHTPANPSVRSEKTLVQRNGLLARPMSRRLRAATSRHLKAALGDRTVCDWD
jgi:hypothetical protein